MKKIFMSLGAVALGATAAHASSAAGMAMGDNSRVWSVAASLRGFYDDNYTTSVKGSERDSFGVMITPSIMVKVPLDQTTWAFRYTYGATWYQDRAKLDSSNSGWDQSHEFEGMFSHSFSERSSIDISDSFAIAQEPELLTTSGVNTFPYRVEGNNIRNHLEITHNGALSSKLSYVLGYQNYYYDYENEGFDVVAPTTVTGPSSIYTINSSLSGLLDRMEHEGLVNLRWQAAKETVLIAGYNYRQVNYTSDELIANTQTLVDALPPLGFYVPNGGTNNVSYVKSNVRDSRSHIIYGGVDQNFSKELTASLRAGVQFTDYFNDPNSSEATSPWINGNLTYTYMPGSSLRVGVSHMRSQTDVVAPDAFTGSVTTDQQTTVVYGMLRHRITPSLIGSLNGQAQFSEFHGGTYDGLSDSFYDVGLNLNYRFNNHFSGEVGYNYSTLSSDIAGRDYDRNRIYVGVIAAY